MVATKEEEYFDVIICGCGPTGALLSAYLSQLRVKHVVLEKEQGITTDPRGIALDEDGIRIVQGIGKYEELFTEVGKGIFQPFLIGYSSAYSPPRHGIFSVHRRRSRFECEAILTNQQ